MDRHDSFKSNTDTQFQMINRGDNLNQALAERRGCDASKILNEMPSNGTRLDAIRDYQRETKNDSQHFPKIDVNFNKDGYEIKAQPNKDVNDVKGDKSQSIAKANFDGNDNLTDAACKNMPVKDDSAQRPSGGNNSFDFSPNKYEFMGGSGMQNNQATETSADKTDKTGDANGMPPASSAGSDGGGSGSGKQPNP